MNKGSNVAKLALVAIIGFAAAGLSQSADAAAKHSERHSAAWADSQFRASQPGPFPERVGPDGTPTGPIPRSANGG
jgi:hypothetical protein